MKLQSESTEALTKLTPRTVSEQSHTLGIAHDEPLIYGLDGMIRYAKAYAKRFGSKLSDDGVLGAAFLQTIKGYRALLDGDGAVAYEMGRTTDSKDNGVCESMFWSAMNSAGFSEADLYL